LDISNWQSAIHKKTKKIIQNARRGKVMVIAPQGQSHGGMANTAGGHAKKIPPIKFEGIIHYNKAID
jgi:hypothetical protein